MTTATAWDGVGPKRECLLRVRWEDSGEEEWMHFIWDDADYEPDGEDGWIGNPDRYRNEASSVTIQQGSDGWMDVVDEFNEVNGADFTVTHWAELPTITEAS